MFKDFAIWTTGTNGVAMDPVVSYVRSGQSNTSGVVGNPWTRGHVTFTPDRDSKYLAVGARVLSPNAIAGDGLEHLQAQYFTNWQLERAVPGSFAPRAYSPAREVQVTVNPDRLNHVTNPSFETNASGWSGNINAFVVRSTAKSYRGVASGAITSTSNATVSVRTSSALSSRLIVRGGTEYTAQAQLLAGSVDGREFTLSIEWYTAAGAPITTTPGTSVWNEGGDTWTQVAETDVAPETAAFATMLVSVSDVEAEDEVHYIDDVMFEEGAEVRPYFDGSLGDDYIWESGGLTHQSRSYYYENRLERNEAILRGLRDTVPIGIGVGVPQFGVFTG